MVGRDVCVKTFVQKSCKVEEIKRFEFLIVNTSFTVFAGKD